MTAKEHYDTHLAKVYSWMLGDFSTRVQEQKEIFDSLDIRPRGNGCAIDLGAGTGIQSIALAHVGYSVTAVDFSRELLAELECQRNGLPITIREADILNFLQGYDQRPELIVCMGDTLTHLPDYEAVNELIENISEHLDNNGTAAFSFRDYSEEKEGADRFIHVRSDDSRSMVCFLEYFPGYVLVHDLVLEKYDGRWTQKIGRYRKLRIAPPLFIKALNDNGLSVVDHQLSRGKTIIIARKDHAVVTQ